MGCLGGPRTEVLRRGSIAEVRLEQRGPKGNRGVVPLHPGLGSQPAGVHGGWGGPHFRAFCGPLHHQLHTGGVQGGAQDGPWHPLLCPATLTSVCRFMCSRRVNFFPQMSQG